MAKETKKTGILGDMQNLSATMELNKELLPDLEPFRLKLNGLVTQTVEAGRQQAAMKASKQELSKQVRQFLTDGQRMVDVIRTAVRDHFGPKSEKLAEFGLQALPRPQGQGGDREAQAHHPGGARRHHPAGNHHHPRGARRPRPARQVASIVGSTLGDALVASPFFVSQVPQTSSLRFVDRGRCYADCGLRSIDCGRDSIDRGRCSVNRSLRSVDRGRCQIDCGLCDVDRGRCSVDCGLRSMDRGRDDVDCGRCSIDHGCDDVNRGRCSIDRGLRSVDCGLRLIDCGRCHVDRSRCHIDRGLSSIDRSQISLNASFQDLLRAQPSRSRHRLQPK